MRESNNPLIIQPGVNEDILRIESHFLTWYEDGLDKIEDFYLELDQALECLPKEM